MRRLRTVVLALTLSAGLAWAADDPAAELKQLEGAFKEAMTAYYAPLRAAKTPEERKAIQLDPAKNPARELLPKFLELAARAKGTDAGAKAATAVLFQAGALGADGEALAAQAQETLVADFVNATASEDVAFFVSMRPPKGVDATKLLEGLGKSTNPSVQAALAAAGPTKVAGDPKAPAEAKEKALGELEQVAAKYPQTSYGRKARGTINAERHLVVGKPAIDFSATDEHGKAFKLSDYRGKAVLLDFWGFW